MDGDGSDRMDEREKKNDERRKESREREIEKWLNDVGRNHENPGY